MDILYDGNIYGLQSMGGITRYFGSLISRLPLNCNPSLVVDGNSDPSYPLHPNLKIFKYDQFRRLPLSYRLSLYYSRLKNQLLEYSLTRKHFDVLHPTYYSLLGGRSIGDLRLPVVITVWDMIHELFANELDPTGENAAEKRKAIEAAQKIICISKNTKHDLLERYAVAESKIEVTYLAPELSEAMSHGQESVPARPYYLYVGSRASYKNFDGLLDAFSKAISTCSELALGVVGSPLNKLEKQLIAELGLTDHVEYFGYITDNHLAKLYRCSIALIYPSLYEGFGLPPLEAMACGTVTVASNTSSLPEVVGDAGILFDPSATDQLIDILRSLLYDDARREQFIEKGRLRARQFSWERTVAETIDVYRAVAS